MFCCAKSRVPATSSWTACEVAPRIDQSCHVSISRAAAATYLKSRYMIGNHLQQRRDVLEAGAQLRRRVRQTGLIRGHAVGQQRVPLRRRRELQILGWGMGGDDTTLSSGDGRGLVSLFPAVGFV